MLKAIVLFQSKWFYTSQNDLQWNRNENTLLWKEVEWKTLNVITENVIDWLMWWQWQSPKYHIMQYFMYAYNQLFYHSVNVISLKMSQGDQLSGLHCSFFLKCNDFMRDQITDQQWKSFGIYNENDKLQNIKDLLFALNASLSRKNIGEIHSWN